jgi:hypothetical protein
MAAKVHKSLRLDSDLVERVEALRIGDEPLSNAMCRVMAVGCDTLEGVALETTIKHAHNTQETDVYTAKLINMLEKENARLVSEHENDLRRIEEKDGQLAAALEKAHDLAEQAHVLTGRAQEAGQLPSTDEGGEVLDVTPVPQKIRFWDWFNNYR